MVVVDRKNYLDSRDVVHVVAAQGPEIVESLLPIAEHGSAFCRSQALKSLAEIGDPRATTIFLEALRKDDTATWSAAVAGLAKLKEHLAEPLLLTGLATELADKPEERYQQIRQVIYALGSVGGGKSVDPLLEIVQDKKSSFRYAAAETLGELRNPRSIPVLMGLLGEIPQSTSTSEAHPYVGPARGGPPTAKGFPGDFDAPPTPLYVAVSGSMVKRKNSTMLPGPTSVKGRLRRRSRFWVCHNSPSEKLLRFG